MILGGFRTIDRASERPPTRQRGYPPLDLLTLYEIAPSRREMLTAFEELDEACRELAGEPV